MRKVVNSNIPEDTQEAIMDSLARCLDEIAILKEWNEIGEEN